MQKTDLFADAGISAVASLAANLPFSQDLCVDEFIGDYDLGDGGTTSGMQAGSDLGYTNEAGPASAWSARLSLFDFDIPTPTLPPTPPPIQFQPRLTFDDLPPLPSQPTTSTSSTIPIGPHSPLRLFFKPNIFLTPMLISRLPDRPAESVHVYPATQLPTHMMHLFNGSSVYGLIVDLGAAVGFYGY